MCVCPVYSRPESVWWCSRCQTSGLPGSGWSGASDARVSGPQPWAALRPDWVPSPHRWPRTLDRPPRSGPSPSPRLSVRPQTWWCVTVTHTQTHTHTHTDTLGLCLNTLGMQPSLHDITDLQGWGWGEGALPHPVTLDQ